MKQSNLLKVAFGLCGAGFLLVLLFVWTDTPAVAGPLAYRLTAVQSSLPAEQAPSSSEQTSTVSEQAASSQAVQYEKSYLDSSDPPPVSSAAAETVTSHYDDYEDEVVSNDEIAIPPDPVPQPQSSAPDQNAMVNLNTATRDELMTLNGIGPVLADRILAFRTEAGEFHSVEDLLAVQGIGEKTLEKLLPRIFV